MNGSDTCSTDAHASGELPTHAMQQKTAGLTRSPAVGFANDLLSYWSTTTLVTV